MRATLYNNEYFPWKYSLPVKFAMWYKKWIWLGCLLIIPEGLQITSHAWLANSSYINRCDSRRDLGKKNNGAVTWLQSFHVWKWYASENHMSSPHRSVCSFFPVFLVFTFSFSLHYPRGVTDRSTENLPRRNLARMSFFFFFKAQENKTF